MREGPSVCTTTQYKSPGSLSKRAAPVRKFIFSCGNLFSPDSSSPETRLPSERAMMAQLNRSRPTIREALRMLEQGGYIASTHGAPGAVVQEPSLHGVEEPLAEMIPAQSDFAAGAG